MIRIAELSRETTIRGQKITILTHDVQEVDQVINKYRNKPLQIKIEPIMEKRSLNANAYHYALCDKIAKALMTTQEEVHAMLMVDWGTPFTKDGRTQYTLVENPKSYAGVYLRPTGHYEDRKGRMYQWCIVIKPSHLYDTAEMSRLIDGTIESAKELGIETATPDEIERMKASWKGAIE